MPPSISPMSSARVGNSPTNETMCCAISTKLVATWARRLWSTRQHFRSSGISLCRTPGTPTKRQCSPWSFWRAGPLKRTQMRSLQLPASGNPARRVVLAQVDEEPRSVAATVSGPTISRPKKKFSGPRSPQPCHTAPQPAPCPHEGEICRLQYQLRRCKREMSALRRRVSHLVHPNDDRRH